MIPSSNLTLSLLISALSASLVCGGPYWKSFTEPLNMDNKVSPAIFVLAVAIFGLYFFISKPHLLYYIAMQVDNTQNSELTNQEKKNHIEDIFVRYKDKTNRTKMTNNGSLDFDTDLAIDLNLDLGISSAQVKDGLSENEKEFKKNNFYEQFKRFVPEMTNDELMNLQGKRIHYNKSASNFQIKDLAIKTQDPEETDRTFKIRIDIAFHGKVPSKGCNFEATQTFSKDSEERISSCSSTDYFNGSYAIECVNMGASCTRITVKLLLCFYQAYSMEPRHISWNYSILNKTFCFRDSTTVAANDQEQDIISWSVGEKRNKFNPDKLERCLQLYLGDSPVTLMKNKEICKCIRERYDHIYPLGTSHMGHFSDYLMVKCEGSVFDKRPVIRGHSDAGNLHWRVGTHLHTVHSLIKNNLTSWSKPGSKIAVWICTGSWDLSGAGLNYAIEIGVERYLREALMIIRERQRSCDACVIDVRVLTTPPMPSRHHVNFIAVQTLNSRLSEAVLELGFELVDMYSVVMPCREDTAQNGRQRHHYLQRDGKTFDGDVGKTFFFGVFLPNVCQK